MDIEHFQGITDIVEAFETCGDGCKPGAQAMLYIC